MRRPVAAVMVAAGVAAATLLAAGCGGSDGGEATPGATTGTTAGVTSRVAVRATDPRGNRVVVRLVTLPVGTRTAAEERPNGATGCVQRGTVTLFAEGREPQVAHDGTCFFIDPAQRVSMANTGTDPAAVFSTVLTPPDAPAATASTAIARAAAVPRTPTINGRPVPGRHTNTISSTVALDEMAPGGTRYLYFLDVRAAGTRAPIHVHPYGGITCVKEGQATLYQQGAAPRRARAGQCFWMAPSTPMANSNRGTTTAVLFDEFILPDDAPYWRIIEPGASHITHGIGDPGKLPY